MSLKSSDFGTPESLIPARARSNDLVRPSSWVFGTVGTIEAMDLANLESGNQQQSEANRNQVFRNGNRNIWKV